MVNKLSKNKDYLSKSKINDFYKNLSPQFKTIGKQYYVNAFSKCKYKIDTAGMYGNSIYRRRTKYVKKQDLFYQAMSDFIKDSHRRNK